MSHDSATTGAAAADPAAGWPALTLQWLSLYRSCCEGEGEHLHPSVLNRVVPALGAASVLTAPPSIDPTTASTQSVSTAKAPLPIPVVCVDLTGLCMTLAEWSATLRSFTTGLLLLQRLCLRDTNVGDVALRAFCKAAATTTSTTSGAAVSSRLEVLDVSGAGLRDAGPLALLLSTSPRLHTLDVSCNHLGVHPSGLALLCNAVQLHPRLATLDLSHNYVRGTEGGTVMAALAEMVVARSVGQCSADHGGGSDDGATTTVPLRRLYLAHNLLGAYYFARSNLDTMCALARDVDEAGAHHAHGSSGSLLRSAIVSAGGGLDVHHETISAFPLVTALYLNNALVELDLKDNGLPDTLLEYVEAKLHVNRRSQQLDCHSNNCSSGRGEPSCRSVPLERVREVLDRHLQSALRHLRTCAEAPGDLHSEAPEEAAMHTPAAAVSQEELLTRLMRSVMADLSLT